MAGVGFNFWGVKAAFLAGKNTQFSRNLFWSEKRVSWERVFFPGNFSFPLWCKKVFRDKGGSHREEVSPPKRKGLFLSPKKGFLFFSRSTRGGTHTTILRGSEI